jgi:TonB family protein
MNTAVAPEKWEGQVINGKFPLLQWLGGTGRTCVFSTEIPGLKAQKAAIKLIPIDPANGDQVSRWQTAAILAHPHLLKIFDGGECEINARPMLYVVMELADENLSHVLPTRPLAPNEAEQLVAPVLDVLKYLQQRGLVHSRIRPTNIVAVKERLKLSSDSLRTAGEVVGLRGEFSAYDAPEIGTGPISPASDVWSLGATLVAALTQKSPLLDRKTPADPSVPESIPQPFRQIARECLRRNPAERCTLDQIQQRLHGAPATEEISVAPKSSKLKIVAPLAALILLGGFFGTKWLSSRNESRKEVSEAKEAPAPATSTPNAGSNAAVAIGNVPGSVIDRVLPEVSRSARMTIHGKIKVGVRVNVNAAGGVSGATLVVPGPSHYFANLALRASQQWKFKPAEVKGQPVASEWMLQFLFGRDGPEVNPRETRP